MRSTYNASTFAPYDPSAILGDTSPTTPTPQAPRKAKGNNCGVFGAILMVAVAVAVAAVVGPAIIGAAAVPATASSAAVAATGLTATLGVTGGAIVGGAIAGIAGSVASQAFGLATGIQDRFDWKGVALAGLSGGIGAGLGSVSGLSKIAGSQFLGDVARGAIGSALTQGVGVATGLQSKFDFAGVAAAGVGAGVGGALGRALKVQSFEINASAGNIANHALTGTAAAIANAATRSLIAGTDFGDNVLAALPDVIGQTLGSLLAGAFTGPDPMSDAVHQVRERESLYGELDGGRQAQIAQGARLLADAQGLTVGEVLDNPDMQAMLLSSVAGDSSSDAIEARFEARKEILRRAGVSQDAIDRTVGAMPTPAKFLGFSDDGGVADGAITVSAPVRYALDVLETIGGYVTDNIDNPYLSTGLFLYGAVTAPISTAIMAIIDYSPAGDTIRRAGDAVVGKIFDGVKGIADTYDIDLGRVGRIALGGLAVVGGVTLGYKAVPLLRRGVSLIKEWGAKGIDNGAVASNAARGAALKEVLRVTEAANPLVDSLRASGKLPSNFVTNAQARAAGWSPGKALENYIPGGQIGGDVFRNSTGVLPSAKGRVWYEADVGLLGTMSRSNQPGSRLLYSNDGKLFITTNHYETVHPIGTWK
jgi:hypothetical protein